MIGKWATFEKEGLRPLVCHVWMEITLNYKRSLCSQEKEKGKE